MSLSFSNGTGRRSSPRKWKGIQWKLREKLWGNVCKQRAKAQKTTSFVIVFPICPYWYQMWTYTSSHPEKKIKYEQLFRNEVWVQPLSANQIRSSYYCWLQLKRLSEGFTKQQLTHWYNSLPVSARLTHMIKITMLITIRCVHMGKIFPAVHKDVTISHFSFCNCGNISEICSSR